MWWLCGDQAVWAESCLRRPGADPQSRGPKGIRSWQHNGRGASAWLPEWVWAGSGASSTWRPSLRQAKVSPEPGKWSQGRGRSVGQAPS